MEDEFGKVVDAEGLRVTFGSWCRPRPVRRERKSRSSFSSEAVGVVSHFHTLDKNFVRMSRSCYVKVKKKSSIRKKYCKISSLICLANS